MATTKCTHCKETVYPLERTVLAEKVFHRGCAKCAHCQGTLTISSFASADGKLFCKPHFMELFKSTGGKYAFAQSENGPQPNVSKPMTAEKKSVISEEKAQEKASTPKKISKLVNFVAGNAFKAADDAKAKKDSKVSSAQVKPLPEHQVMLEEAKKELKQVRVQAEIPPHVEAVMPNEVTEPKEVAKQERIQVQSGGSKLAAFLGGSTNVSVAEVTEAPTPVEHIKRAAVTPVPSAAPAAHSTSGLSKLSMFLQQVEANPSTAVQSAPAKLVSENKTSQTNVAETKEEQAPVSHLVQKSESRPAKKEETKAVLVQKDDIKPVAVPKEDVMLHAPKVLIEEKKPEPTEGDSSLAKIMERLAMAKATIASSNANLEAECNAKLRAELDRSRTRCAELEAENLTLRARVDLSDAGKEALVQEIARLNAVILGNQSGAPQSATSSFRLPKIPFAEQAKNENENDANHVDASLKHAKKLLAQGKISKVQYDAAVRASVEANRAIMGAN